MNITPEQVQAIHKLFVDLTGRDIPLDLAGCRARQWYDWFQAGFTEADLRLVVAYVKQGIRDGRRNVAALKFVNLIGEPLRFGEDLAEIKAMARKPKMHQSRESVLRATGRPTQHEYKVTPAGEAAFEALRKLKESL